MSDTQYICIVVLITFWGALNNYNLPTIVRRLP